MRELSERSVEVNGRPCRVWEKGEGERIGYLAGLGGIPVWTPFLERLAESRRVIAPSPPGFPGASGHEQLDGLVDWVAATLDLLEGAGLEGADLVGASVGGLLAAEVAALSRATVRRLVLVAPFGLFDDRAPTLDVFAQPPGALADLLCAKRDNLARLLETPKGEDPAEWTVLQIRAAEAAARLLWPTGDLGTAGRLHRIRAPTLVVWGSEDRVIPPSYARRFADGIAGPTEVRSIRGAGHLADVDAPEEVAEAVLKWCR
jgi:pimeloyl-ACP methyl ester carboxylesterase